RVELNRRADGHWQGAAGVPASTETLMVGSEEELFPLRAFRTVTTDAADPQFGLADPDITLEVDDGARRPYRVAFGAATFTDGVWWRSARLAACWPGAAPDRRSRRRWRPRWTGRRSRRPTCRA